MIRSLPAIVLATLLVAVGCLGDDNPEPTIFVVEGVSMEPLLTNGMVLDIHQFDKAVTNGDIVVFWSPISPTRQFVKRVIAGPGQEVGIASLGRVLVDRARIDEPYVKGATACMTTGAGCQFHIPASDDTSVPDPAVSPLSIEVGGDQTAKCEATACYFVMGDNRQNSSDSRQGWLVPVDNIIGYVEAPR